jgi:signal transduction histidine kinase
MRLDRTALGTAGKMVTLFAVYLIAAKLGLMMDAVAGFATLVWPPTGLALAALLLFGNRLWPGIWLGAFAVNVWTGAPPGVALGIATGNTLEAVLGAYLLCRLAGFQGSFDRLRHVIGLVGPVAFGSTLISATFGVASLWLGHIVSAHQWWATWRAWWVGDMLGDLVVAPLLLTWASLGDLKIKPMRFVEATLLGGALVGANLAVFFKPAAVPFYPIESPYILFPLFIWAALRFELRGATAATALASALAIGGTARALGPFVRETLAQSLLGLQTFMGCAALTPLVVAGAISDRARAIVARENFVAGVSHDLKNPLSVIQMSVVSMARTLPPVSRQQVEKHEQIVLRNVNRMNRLIGDLLDAAAIDAGQMSIEPGDESVRVLVTEAVDLLRPLASARNQELRLAAVEDLRVTCDRVRVLQVMSNLVGNAIKFSESGRIITLRAERDGRAARFSVEDHGTGIAPGQLRHVFERYWRAKPTDGGGTGLGLFLARGIVEAHSGKLWVESKPGVGSTFYFTLPLRDEPAEPQGHTAQDRSESHPVARSLPSRGS